MLSYNPTGWSNMKKDLVRLLILTHNILVCALQEHFQLAANLYKLLPLFTVKCYM